MRRHIFGLVVLLLVMEILALASAIRLAKTESANIVVPDDFLTIQEAINNAVDGDTIFVKIGTYYEHVVVNKTVSLVGEDVRATIIDGDSTDHVVNIVSDFVNVTGFTVQKSGNVGWPTIDAGFCLNGTRGCTVSENRVIDNGFSGVSLLNSQQNTITGNNVTGTGWGGIHMLNSSHNTIFRNALYNNTYVGINGHASSHYNNISENIISNSTYGMFYHDANYNNVCRNNISTIAVEGIWLQDQVNYNVVTGNHLVNITVAIRLQGPNYNNTLSRNVITGAEYGIRIQNYARYTRINENIIINNRAGNDSWSAGIRLDSGRDSQIHSNIITGNYYGILLYSSSPSVFVYNNNITDNEFGLRVASGGSNYLNVSDNIVMNNQGYGIGLTGFGGASNYAIISRNLIVNNSDGIALGQYSNYNMILQNDISQNGYGFYIENSTQNTIWGNNVADNDQQVYVSTGSINEWDRGYPSGGNHWSDYDGTDFFRGPHQNVTGRDGIGDTPHTLNNDVVDNYPLMGSFGSATLFGIRIAVFPSKVVGLIFENVTSEGSTTVTDIMDGPDPPSGRTRLGYYYDIETTASYSGNITIRIIYDDTDITEEDEKDLRLYQWNSTDARMIGDITGPGGWQDGRVDILDIATVAILFGIALPDPKYDLIGDLTGSTPGVPDGKIDILDIAFVAINFGQTTSKWEDITTYIDAENNLICGETSHFSIFGVH